MMHREPKTSRKIESFTDLNAWKEAHKLVIMVYFSTKAWPKDEDYGLRSQIRRAAVAISSNIAEGFSRETKADKNHFYVMAKGSTTEVQNQLLIAKDIHYTEAKEFSKLATQSVTVNKLITGLLKSLKAGKGVRI